MDASVWFKAATACAMLVGCASREPARSVSEDLLRYRATATAVGRENARFKADGAALEDLANECSLIPKSTRVANEVFDQRHYEYKVVTTLSVPLADCMRARPTLDPRAIREMADAALTARLKLYQDYDETGVIPTAKVRPHVTVPEDLPSVPDRDSHWDDSDYFYVLRQTAVYLKQIPVLAPEGAFAGLPETRRFNAAVEPVESLLRAMQANNPSLRTKPLAWSELKDPLRVPRPECLRSNQAGQ